MDWADGFVVVYNISDRASFLNAKNLLRQIREARLEHGKGSAAGSSSALPPLFLCSRFHLELDATIISGSL